MTEILQIKCDDLEKITETARKVYYLFAPVVQPGGSSGLNDSLAEAIQKIHFAVDPENIIAKPSEVQDQTAAIASSISLS